MGWCEKGYPRGSATQTHRQSPWGGAPIPVVQNFYDGAPAMRCTPNRDIHRGFGQPWRGSGHPCTPSSAVCAVGMSKRRSSHEPITPTQGESDWVGGWPYRVFKSGKVQVGTAKVGTFKHWSFSLFSYEGIDYENFEERRQCVREEIKRRGIGPGPGAPATETSMCHCHLTTSSDHAGVLHESAPAGSAALPPTASGAASDGTL